jgi:hypothetical protein
MTKNNVKEGRLVLAHGFRQSVHGWLTHALGQNIMVRGTVLEELLTPWWTGQRERLVSIRSCEDTDIQGLTLWLTPAGGGEGGYSLQQKS